MRFSILLAPGLVYAAVAPNTTVAQSIDDDARVVELRSSCLVDGTMLHNCFETSAELTDWLWVNAGTGTGRASEPNSLEPVTVRVGPGSFDRFDCEGSGMRGFVSVEGAGRDVTRFVADVPVFYSPVGACRGGVTALGCTNLSFRNITAEGFAGVLWTGTGDSQWQDVDMFVENVDATNCLSEAFAWYDVLSAGGLHFFWNTRFEAVGSTGATNAFRNNGAEVWAYGSDFFVRRVGNISVGSPTAIQSAAPDGMRLFGSTVRGKVDADAGGGSVLGIQALGQGQVHVHGSIISIDASAHPAGAAIAISVGAGATVHTPETAFALKGSTRIRLLNLGGTIESPFLWPSGTTPPDILSQTGADLFVKTNEGPGQNEPRLLIYDSGCSPDPWRRVSDDTCL